MTTLTLESTITELLTEMNKTQAISQPIDQLTADFESENMTILINEFIDEQIKLGAETDYDPLGDGLFLHFKSPSGQEIMMYASGKENESYLELNE